MSPFSADRLRHRGPLVLLPVLLVASSLSCTSTNSIKTSKPDEQQTNSIRAQGQIQPAGGLIRLNGTPGDSVEMIHVKAGDKIEAGKELVTLKSQTTRESQVKLLKQQLVDARLQQSAAIEKAEMELSAARMTLKQADQQSASVNNRRPSIELLKSQWHDAQAALGRIEAISQDPLTRAMVSRLEIDKQRANVTAAQLQYQTQQETLDQAELAATSGTELAHERVRAAEKALELAKRIDPATILETQLAAAEQQLLLSKIVSPIKGTVVSVDARVGESIAQFPLVQVADLSKMICQVEIYEADARRVKFGQTATLKSGALEHPLTGKVAQIELMVGHPQLRATDPLARTDYRTLPVQVEIDAQHTAEAARWLQLQVEVEIQLGASDAKGEAPSTSSGP